MTAEIERVEAALLGSNRRTGITGRGGRLCDAVHAALDLFPKPYERGHRRAVVAITDDIENKSRTNLDQLTTGLLEADATLNAAILVTGQMYASVSTRSIPLPGIPTGSSRRLGGANPDGKSIGEAVEESGGEMVPGDRFRDEFPQMLRRLRGRFLLGFYAPPVSGHVYRKIEAKLSEEAKARHPNAVVRARRGYYSR
jgi:hypothetical protein